MPLALPPGGGIVETHGEGLPEQVVFVSCASSSAALNFSAEASEQGEQGLVVACGLHTECAARLPGVNAA